MDIVYICSPYRAETEEEHNRNLEYARHLTRQALKDGDCPITPHLYITQCMDDNDDAERKIGMAAGRILLRECSKMIVGHKYGVSKGMREEIKTARTSSIPIVYIVKTKYKNKIKKWQPVLWLP